MENETIAKIETLEPPLYISVNCNDYHFTVIFGKLFKGYYCSVPDWGVSADLSSAMDILYNTERLANAFKQMEEWPDYFALEVGKNLSLAIKEACEYVERIDKDE